MSKMLVELQAVPACLRESLRVCLKVHGIELPPEILQEAGNNMAAGLMSIDESIDDDLVECDKRSPDGFICSSTEHGSDDCCEYFNTHGDHERRA